MSFIIKLIAPASAASRLRQKAEQQPPIGGLNAFVGDPVEPSPLGPPQALCEVHFWHEDLDVANRKINLTGKWNTIPELVEPLAQTIGGILVGESGQVWLEAAWRPTQLDKTERVTLSELLDLIRRNELEMDRRYEVAPTAMETG